MSAFYDRMAATALRLIAQFGQPATLIDVTPGGYDPDTGVTGPVTMERTGSAIVQDYNLRESGAANLAGTVIQQGDKKIMLAALTTNDDGDQVQIEPPTMNTKVTVDGVTWTVANIKSINPAGTPLLYEIQGRR